MHYKMLIADDEYYIRQRIKKLIPWQMLNLKLVKEYDNGLDCLNFLKSHSVDIVLLDIKMPKVDGLEVCRYLFKHAPDTAILLLSGYDQFEYAQHGIRLGVRDYLLKPVEKNRLINSIETCIQVIANTRIQKNHHRTLTLYKMKDALYQVLHQKIKLKNLIVQFPVFKSFTTMRYIGIYISYHATDLEEHLKSMSLDDVFWVCTKESEHIYTLQVFYTKKSVVDSFDTLLNNHLKSLPHFCFMAFGKMIAITEEWLDAYHALPRLLSYRFFDYTILSQHQEHLINVYDNSTFYKDIRESLPIILNTKDENQLKAYLDQQFEDVKQNVSYKKLIFLINECISIYLSYPNFNNKDINDYNTFVNNLVDEEYQLDNLKTTLLNYGKRCMAIAENITADSYIAQNVTAYIKKHYDDTSLNVSVIADYFNLNPSYMNSAFKKINSRSVLQFITMTRMQAAKKLLECHRLQVQEVATKVGYLDAFYFSKRFKKHYGISPSEISRRNGY